MHEVIAWKNSSILALPLMYSSMLLLMLLSICSSNIRGTLNVVLFETGAPLGLLTEADNGGTLDFEEFLVILGIAPIDGTGVLRCDDAADESSFADRC